MADTLRQAKKLGVFISYSRKDMAFVDRLQPALKAHGIDAKVDREDIETGEAWWARIQQLIIEADTVVFVLSPDSITSPVCKDEVDFAESLNKRFVPIVARDLEGNAVPAALARLNYLFFITDAGTGASGDFDEAVDLLVRSLETNIGWLREHTRLGSLALRWESRNQAGELLLRGAELSAAETWLTSRPPKAPDPTDSHRAFITRSRQSATRSQRTIVSVSIVAAIGAFTLAGLAYWQRERAVENEGRAVRSEAETRTVTRQAQRTESGLLANTASTLTDDSGTAMLLALEGLPDKASDDPHRHTREYEAEAEFQLDRAVRNLHEQAVLAGHNDKVTVAAWSPDGARIATASRDETARVWETATGKELARLAHGGEVYSAAWSPDGARLATASSDETARVWEVATGKELARLEHGWAVNAVAWSPDGTRLATATFDYLVRVWETGTGKELARLPKHNRTVRSMVWSPDGARLATASEAGMAGVWDAATGNELAPLDHGGGIHRVAWSPDGALLATASWDKSVRVLEAATAKELVRFDGHCPPGVNYEPNGCWVGSVAWSPDGALLATASDDKTARVWEVATRKQVAKLDHGGEVGSVAWSPEGARLATASGDMARLWEVATGKELVRLDGHCPPGVDYASFGCSVTSVAWSRDGARLATASEDGTARVWRARVSGELVQLVHSGEVDSVAWSPEGARLATASGDMARVWEAATSNELARLDYGVSVGSVVWSPDGARLAAKLWDRSVRVWEAATGKELARLEHGNAVNAVAWSPDGARLATASDNSSARVWEAATGKELARLDGHGDAVWAVAWSPGGARLATASRDTTARVWEVARGKELARFEGHGASVKGVAFDPAGVRIVTGSGDRTARVWRVSQTTDHLVQSAREHVRRCLTRAQRAAYFLPLAPPSWCVERRLWPYHTDAWQEWLPKRKAWLASSRQGPEPELPKGAAHASK